MTLTLKQTEALEVFKKHKYIKLYGGARSGKTFFTVLWIVTMCLHIPGLNCVIARRYMHDIRPSIFEDTLPKVLELLDLHIGKEFTQNATEMVIRFPNGSQITCAGLDNKERTDKILGQEFAIIYINECGDVVYSTVKKLRTRLAQNVRGFINRLIVDHNPEGKAHWSYKMWELGIDPETKLPITNRDKFGSIQMNPQDNFENLPPGYIESELATLTGGAHDRFYLGEYANDNELRVFDPPLNGYYEWSDFLKWGENRWANVRLVGGLDLGYQDADAFEIAAFIDGDPDIWIVFEHKARRESIDQLAEAIKQGMSWCWANIPNNEKSMQIYADTSTVRYGHEGDSKKSMRELARNYGLPVVPAYKRDKRIGIEFLQGQINSGHTKIMRNGAFSEEIELILWTKLEDGTIVREIDDDAYHPDSMDAVLYLYRYLMDYGNSSFKSNEFSVEKYVASPDALEQVVDWMNERGEIW